MENTNAFVRNILAEELRFRTRLSDDAISVIVDGFFSKLGRRRMTMVSTYLADDMYDAQIRCVGDIPYNDASKMYRAALEQFNSRISLPEDPSEDGSFW